MSKTISRLLEKLKINHHIPHDSPLLALPLSLFKKEEYIDLVSILWLYSEKFIDRSKKFKSTVVMGDISKGHVSELYQSVKGEVSMALALLETDENQLIPWSIQTKPNGWVNATQVTHFLKNDHTYNILFGCFSMINILTEWVETDHFDALDFLDELEIQQIQGVHELITAKVISTMPHIKPLDDHPNPQRLIYDCVINLNKKMSLDEISSDDVTTLNYFHEVMTSLAKHYPPTIQIFLFSLGIAIPDNLDPHLALILRQNLFEVDSLTEQEWPQLIYYISLFIAMYAQTDRSMLEFTYANTEFLDLLDVLAQKHGKQFNKYLDMLDDTEAASEPCSDEQLRNIIREELDGNGLSTLHPMLLGLLCFENCKPLKELFKMVYQQDTLVINNSTTALRPSANPFLLGEVLSIGNPQQLLKISNHDLTRLDRLIVLARQINTKSDKEKPHSEESESDTAISSDGEELSMRREQYNARHNGGYSFFPLPASSRTFSEFLQMDEHSIEFHDVRSMIEDEQLRESISGANAMSHYRFTPVINYCAITQFILDYRIDSPKHISPTYLQLKDFFEVVRDNDTLDLIVTKLAPLKLFVDLDALETLDLQIDNLNNSINYLHIFLKVIKKNPDDEELKLRRLWLETQKSACIKFKEMLVNKAQEIEEAKEDEEDEESESCLRP